MVCADLCGYRCPDCSWACRRESVPPESDVDYLAAQRALAGDREAIAYIKKMRRLVPAFPYENPRSREKIEAEALYRLNDAARLLKTHPAASAEDAAEAGGLLQALTGDERSAFYSHYPHSWNFMGLKGVEARTPLAEAVMGEFQRSDARRVLGLTTLAQFNPRRRFRVGDRVRVEPLGSGIDSGKSGTVVKPFDWHLEEGAYKPPGPGWIYLKLDEGRLITMHRDRLDFIEANPAACGEERFTRAHGHEVCAAAKGHKQGQDRWTPMQANPKGRIQYQYGQHYPGMAVKGRRTRWTKYPKEKGKPQEWGMGIEDVSATLWQDPETKMWVWKAGYPDQPETGEGSDKSFKQARHDAERAVIHIWEAYPTGDEYDAEGEEPDANPAAKNRAANARAMWAYNIGKLTHTNPGLWAGVAEAENPLSTQEIEGINHLAFSHAQSAVGWGPERGIRGRQKQRTEGGLGVLAARRELQGLQGEANPQFADQAAQAIHLIDRAAGEAGDRAYGLFSQAADAITSLPAATEVRDELDARFRSAAKHQMDRGVLGHGRFAELTNRIQAENNPAKPRAFYSARRKADWHRSRGRRARVLAVAGGKYDVFLDGRRETRARITITRGRKARVSTLRDTETSLPIITVEAPVDIKRSDIEQAAQAAAAALPADATNEDLAKEMGQALADIIADIPEPAPA